MCFMLPTWMLEMVGVIGCVFYHSFFRKEVSRPWRGVRATWAAT